MSTRYPRNRSSRSAAGALPPELTCRMTEPGLRVVVAYYRDNRRCIRVTQAARDRASGVPFDMVDLNLSNRRHAKPP